MSNAGSSREIEIKLPLPDAGTGRRALGRAGFQVRRDRVFETNVVYDTPGGELARAEKLLRVRQTGDSFLLTYKGPGQSARHKVREELETGLTDADQFDNMLKRLGFLPSFRYEKYRTEYERPAEPGAAMLDETPIGAYLELEGAPDWIDAMALELGFTEPDYILASYGRLYVEWCRDRGESPSHMVFGDPGDSSIRDWP